MEELTVFENELADKATFVIHLLNCIYIPMFNVDLLIGKRPFQDGAMPG